MTRSRACAVTRNVGCTLLAPAVLAAFMAFVSTGVAYAQPSDGDDRDCQATAGVDDSGQPSSDGASTGDNAGNCGQIPPPPVLISPLGPILCNVGAICVP